MRITISIPDELFKTAEAFAQHYRLSRSELYTIALRAYLQSRQQDRKTEQLNAIYGQEISTIAAEIIEAQAAILRKDEW
jgi:metal-responsive CopG/Arc/MetJ family transcriptional regulator